ncbi:hypothetical protein DLAC_05396 [Tieghemostelium lacteum]|uniref:Thioredoxin domain-containing protein n=1 Tax=Tieghemostelium lacteum TaxID=361077 RepID=A0A151ZFQ9_TIELA|nr:hypothetical protein DLAC_05396 [Tieghemostelium lacteum]|eukprot:KYQ92812.1 hypothetical protein DLAC_05396 [Tieghemostelium lacteum]
MINENKIDRDKDLTKPVIVKKKRGVTTTVIHYTALILLLFLLLTYNIKDVDAQQSDISVNNIPEQQTNENDNQYYEAQSTKLVQDLIANISTSPKSDATLKKLAKSHPIYTILPNYYQIHPNIVEYLDSKFKHLYFVYVLYHPDCAWSQHLLPILLDVSKQYPNITFFQIPSLKLKLRKQIYAKTTPSLAFSASNFVHKYTGPKNFDEISKWIQEKTTHNYTTTTSSEEIDSNNNNNNNNSSTNVNNENSNLENTTLSQQHQDYKYTSEKSYLLLFSCCYVIFLIGLAIYRLFIQSIRRMKQD